VPLRHTETALTLDSKIGRNLVASRFEKNLIVPWSIADLLGYPIDAEAPTIDHADNTLRIIALSFLVGFVFSMLRIRTI
jgi:hypothetical protein